MCYKRFTPEQIEFIVTLLKENKSYNEIILQIPVSKSSLNRICNNYNIQYIPKSARKLNYTEIFKLADSGLTPTKIAKILNVNAVSVTSILNTNGYSFKLKHNNIRYFEHCDSHTKAYFLGFIAADGAIVSNGGNSMTLTITIHSKDAHILHRLKKELDSEANIAHITTKMPHCDKHVDHVRLAIGSPLLCKDLQQYGITPRKSLTMPNIIENIPKEYRSSFILGYFDGDGSVMFQNSVKQHKNKKIYPSRGLVIGIRGTEALLKGIVKELNIVNSSIRYDSTHYLSFSKKNEVVKLFNCYTNLDIFLPRKRDRFLERISHVSWNKFIQVQTISLPELKI